MAWALEVVHPKGKGITSNVSLTKYQILRKICYRYLVRFCDNAPLSFLITFNFNVTGYFLILIQVNIRVSLIRC